MADSPPSCFGVHWDPTETDCAGGRDPAHFDGTGSHIKGKCDFFSACGARTQAAKQAAKLVPTANLTKTYSVQQNQQPQYSWMPHSRPQTPQTAVVPVQQPSAQNWQQAMNGYFREMQQGQPTKWQPPGNVWPPPQQPPPVAYQQMMPVNYQMPSYLSVPEPRDEDSSIWSVLAKEIARSALKSTGHTIANFFDWTPWG